MAIFEDIRNHDALIVEHPQIKAKNIGVFDRAALENLLFPDSSVSTEDRIAWANLVGGALPPLPGDGIGAMAIGSTFVIG